jgi:hypothetical protein
MRSPLRGLLVAATTLLSTACEPGEPWRAADAECAKRLILRCAASPELAGCAQWADAWVAGDGFPPAEGLMASLPSGTVAKLVRHLDGVALAAPAVLLGGAASGLLAWDGASDGTWALRARDERGPWTAEHAGGGTLAIWDDGPAAYALASELPRALARAACPPAPAPAAVVRASLDPAAWRVAAKHNLVAACMDTNSDGIVDASDAAPRRPLPQMLRGVNQARSQICIAPPLPLPRRLNKHCGEDASLKKPRAAAKGVQGGTEFPPHGCQRLT